MRHFSLFFTLIGLSCILSSSSCDKEDPPSACCDCLKPATQSGRGTMSMLINGKPWSNCNEKNTSYRTVGVYWDIYTFRISGAKNYAAFHATEKMYIEVHEPFVGEYKGPITLALFGIEFRDSPKYGSSNFVMDTTKPFNLTVTKFDETNHIISGTFNGYLLKRWGDSLTVNSLHITQGNFDTTY